MDTNVWDRDLARYGDEMGAVTSFVEVVGYVCVDEVGEEEAAGRVGVLVKLRFAVFIAISMREVGMLKC